MPQLSSIENIDKIINHYKPQDIEVVKEFVRIDNEDRKDDSQRLMTWFALAGMVFYPLVVAFCDALELDKASSFIAEMADMYFISVSAIVMTFFGANALSNIKARTQRNQADLGKRDTQ